MNNPWNSHTIHYFPWDNRKVIHTFSLTQAYVFLRRYNIKLQIVILVWPHKSICLSVPFSRNILSVASLRTRCINFLWIMLPVPITCCYIFLCFSLILLLYLVGMRQREHQNINLHVWINLVMLPVIELHPGNWG